MRLGLIGDIHGDIKALETALRHLEHHDVGGILCAGDVVGYGAQPDAVIALLRELHIPCIRGNHDRWAIEKRSVIGIRGWKPARFKDSTWEFLEALPSSLEFELCGRKIAMHHGSPASDMEFVSPYKPLPESLEKFWETSEADVLILAHTHMPLIDRSLKGTIVNAGSTHGVSGVQTSYSFGVLDLEDLSVRIMENRLGRETRRDPVFLDGSQEE